MQSVARAAELLKALDGPATVFELADRCGLNRSTAWRILATLEDSGLVERDSETGRYAVGYALVGLAAGAGHEPLVRRAHPHLRALAGACAETASLAVPRALELVYVDQVRAPHVMAANWLGRPTPLHATSTGKALLSVTDPAEVLVMLGPTLQRYTDTTVTDLPTLLEEIEQTRRRGWGACRGEFEISAHGVSSPVLDRYGRVRAVLSIWGPGQRVTDERLPELGALAREAAARLGGL